jgi:hypothetical protein
MAYLMLGNAYKELEHEEAFDTIEDALLTSCPVCGTELEWELTVQWNNKTEMPAIYGKAFSCGIKFFIEPTDEGYRTLQQ